jgi:hypothetical protein
MNIKQILTAFFAVAVAASALAQWQWLDKDGRKVYSDRAPPTDIPDKSIVKQPGGGRSRPADTQAAASVAAAASAAAAAAPAASAASAAASAAKAAASAPKLSTKDKELEEKKKAAEEAEAAKKKAEEERVAKVKAENCERARKTKITLDSGIRVATVNSKGEREVMDDAARAAELKRAQDAINSECK